MIAVWRSNYNWHSRRARARTGITLIEMLVAILVGGAILASAATLVSKVITANSAAAEHLHSMQAIGELGRQFRDDVHRATTVTIGQDEAPTLSLQLDDGSRVEYHATTAGVAREQSTEKQALRRETYGLGAFKLTGIRRDTDDSRAVQLVIGRVARHVDAQMVQGQFAITAVGPATTSDTEGGSP